MSEQVLTERTSQFGIGRRQTGTPLGDKMCAHVIVGFDFTKLVAAGEVTGLKVINKFGMNDALSTSRECIQSQGGMLAHPTAAGKVKLISTNSGDNAAGLGAQQVYIAGVNGAYEFTEETILMHASDGTILSPESTNSYLFVYIMRVIRRGVLIGYNLGNLDAEFTLDAGTSICRIPLTDLGVGSGTSMTTHYIVPKGKIAFVNAITVNIESSKTVDYATHVMGPPTSLTDAPFDGVLFNPIYRRLTDSNVHTDASDYAIFLPEKYHIWATAKVNVGPAFMFVNYQILEMDNFVQVTP